jgi:HK97 family phage major capsid protein
MNMRVPPLETKSAGGQPDEVKAALGELTSVTTVALAELKARLDGIEKRANRPPLSSGTGASSGDGAAEYKALSTFVRSGDETEMKALSAGSNVDGGYLVHPVISAAMTKRIFDLTPMRRLARLVSIGAGGSFEEPIDVQETGATWVGETDARPATTTPQFGLLTIACEELYALQTVTQRLVDDASIDVGVWVEGKIADKFARSEGTATINGDGVKKPKGILTYPTAATPDLTRSWGTLQHILSGAAGAITADALKDLVWSLRAPYRQGASWLMNSTTANAIDKLKDANGDYLWRAGMTAGAPPSLLGYPVEFSEDMPDIAANALALAFGNFQLGYTIVDKPGVRYLRDPYSSKPNLLFYAYRRTGGAVARASDG